MTARAFSDIFGEADAAAPVAVGVTYATQQVVQLTIPAAGGPFADVNGDTAANSTEPLAVVPVGWVQAADPITPAEFALVNMSEAVSVSSEIRDAHIADAAIHVLAGGTALQLYRRTADGLGYEWADITISSSNTVSGIGAPGPGNPISDAVTDANYYYIQLDAPLGTNDIWGSSVAGTPATWPAQADFKSADPEVGETTDFVDLIEKAKPKAWKAETLDERFLYGWEKAVDGMTLENGKRYWSTGGLTVTAPSLNDLDHATNPGAESRSFRYKVVGASNSAVADILLGGFFDPGSGTVNYGWQVQVNEDSEFTSRRNGATQTLYWTTNQILPGYVEPLFAPTLALVTYNTKYVLRDHIAYTAIGNVLRMPQVVFGRNRFHFYPTSEGTVRFVNNDESNFAAPTSTTNMFLNQGNETGFYDFDIPANIGGYVEFVGIDDKWLVEVHLDQRSAPTRILDNISFSNVGSGGTNAGSRWSFEIFDDEGNAYPPEYWAVSGTFSRTDGVVQAPLVFDRVITDGSIGLGHNKRAPSVSLNYVGPKDKAKGTSSIVQTVVNGANVATEIRLNYDGTNYSDSWIEGSSTPLVWTTLSVVSATDQAAPLQEATEYTEKSIFSWPDPEETDTPWFNWRVKDGETLLSTEFVNGTDAEFIAIKPKLDRFGIGTKDEPELPDWSSKVWNTGDRVIAPMPVNADFIASDGAIAGVKYIFEALNDRPDTVTAFDDTEVDAGNWELIGQFQINGTDDRVLTGAGIMALDPLTTLSNSAKNEFIHWTTLDDAIDVLFGFNPNFITQWKDYTGAGLIQPTAINDVITIPANSQMWVHRSGNALTFTFENNAGGGGVTNALVFPVGNFTALAVNDSSEGDDGAVYRLPDLDNLQITLPAKATMDANAGIYRVRISADWPVMAAHATPMSFIDDATNPVDMGEGLPTDGSEWLDLIWDSAADRWRAVSGGEATLNQAARNIYTNVTDQTVPDTNYNTYAVDLPALEVGDQFTVVMARGVLIYNLIGRFIGFGFEHEFIFDGIVWRVEIVGTQLRIEAFSGGGSQAVKAIFIER